jgi:hypothetical protein
MKNRRVHAGGFWVSRQERRVQTCPPRHSMELNLRCWYGKGVKVVESLDLVLEM